jgi:flagellum-specific peptidoglycan hydrolase FlgJ
MAECAVRSEIRYGVPAEFSLAQGVHETGLRYLAGRNNPLGMKSVNGHYRAFHSLQEAFDEHAELLRHGRRFQHTWNRYMEDENYNAWIVAVSRIYAEDPHYLARIVRTANRPDVVRALNDARSRIQAGRQLP